MYYRCKAVIEDRYVKNLKKIAYVSEDAVIYPTATFSVLSENRSDISIERYSHIRGELFTSYRGKIHIGEYCYVGERTKILAEQNIWIGNRVLIAHDCNIFDSNTHPLDAGERHIHFKTMVEKGYPDTDLLAREIRIEDDVWIGCNTIILKGVTIGKGAIVGAGSVVVKDVKPGTTVGGNPAKELKCSEPV